MNSVPEAVLIAGASGAGKTTFAREFLHVRYPGTSFLNADEIRFNARELRSGTHSQLGASLSGGSMRS
jgi:predicted ABC-type ATPase